MAGSSESSIALDWFANASRAIDGLEEQQTQTYESKKRFRDQLASAQIQEGDGHSNAGEQNDGSNTPTAASQQILPAAVLNARSLPTRKELLDALNALQRNNARVAASGQSPVEGSADLTRIAFATYALALENLFEEADRLQDSTWYWTNIEDSQWSAAIYLSQTLPSRIKLLLGESYKVLCELAQQTTGGDASRPRINRETVLATVRQLRKTPDVVLGAMWPHSINGRLSHADGSTKSEGEATAASESTAVTASSLRGGPGGKALAGPLLLLKKAKRLSPLSLTVHEAHTKRQMLATRRDEVAEHLGELTLMALPLAHGDLDGSLSPEEAEERSCRLVSKLQETLLGGDDESAASAAASSVRPHFLHQALVDLLSSPTILQVRPHTRAPVGLSPPSRLSLIWPRLVLYPTILLISLRMASNNRDVIHEAIINGKETAKGFFMNWIVQPLSDLVDTIRGGDAQSGGEGGSIVTKEGRKADLESLERMVTQYAVEKGQISADDVARREILRRKVREGDLDVVMLAYEDQLKSPLKSLTVGSLPRLLLIQVQKAKYDLAVAMGGIDHLLKSQALLFGAVGIAPAMGIVWAGFKGGKWLLRGRTGADAGDVERQRERAWSSMRRVDRLLTAVAPSAGSSGAKRARAGGKSSRRQQQQATTASSSSSGALSAQAYGNVLLELAALRKIAAQVLLSPGSRKGSQKRRRSSTSSPSKRGNSAREGRLEAFLEDIRELETIAAAGSPATLQQQGVDESDSQSSATSAVAARKAAVERMWRCWSTLFTVPV